MTGPIPAIAVAVSLLREALSILDDPEHAPIAANVREAIDTAERLEPTLRNGAISEIEEGE